MMLQLNPTIDVKTPLGDGEAFFIVDYGVNVNTVSLVYPVAVPLKTKGKPY